MSMTAAPPGLTLGDEAAVGEPIMLDSRAARTCPVKTQNAYLPRLPLPHRPLDPAVHVWREALAERRRRLLDTWADRTPGAVDLRSPVEPSGSPAAPPAVDAVLRALAAGSPLVVGAILPADVGGRRLGAPDALVRGPDRSDGRPGYHPVVIKGHQIITRDPAPGKSDDHPRSLRFGTLTAPSPEAEHELPGHRLKTGSRSGDFLQLAHYVRMLAAAGFGPPGPAWGGVIGTDDLADIDGPGGAQLGWTPGEPVIGWADLGQSLPVFSTAADRERSFLQRYDDEHGFRLAIAETARQHTGNADVDPPLLVSPIVNRECATCPWWDVCRPQLDDDELSLRIERGRLRPREIIALRELGIGTATALADSDEETLVPDYLRQVDFRLGAETRLRTATRRARMLLAGEEFCREGSEPIELPPAEIEIDFDLETAADGRIYLWGFWVADGVNAPHCRQFVHFEDLDGTGELELARQALGWLRQQVTGPRSARVYHYSGFEVAKVRELSERSDDPVLGWAAGYAAAEFVDLLEVIKKHYFGVSGLGLKAIARHAGFRWRDSDPGGLNSQCWFADAVHGPPEQRAQARRRVLEYNEDDVIATSRLRDWLRAQ